MDYKSILQKNKPTLSENSMRTYISLLRNIAKNMGQTEPTLEWFNDAEPIIQFVRENKREINTRKTLLSTLYVLTGNERYRDSFMIDADTIRQDTFRQEMNDKQRKAWVSLDEIKERFHKMMFDYSDFWTDDRPHDVRLQEYQQIVILALIGGIFIPPRRLLDYTEMRINGTMNTQEDNYIDYDKRVLVFNKYKTMRKYGRQEIEIPQELLDILHRWRVMNRSDWLLVNVNGDKLNPSNLNIRINKIFGKQMGCNLFRHIYISEKVLCHMPKLLELQEIARMMAHDIITQMLYRKTDTMSTSSEEEEDS